jgi:hypothetical protein
VSIWSFSQFLSFNARLEKWLNASISIEIKNVPPPATHDPIVAIEKELMPLAFSVEAGAYINAIRSSLDILAMALVRRYSLVIPEDKVSFPFFSTEEAFRKQNGGPHLQKLPAEDRKIIETLKPYAEGNPILWSLHYLDIVRKHRRLLDVRIEPIHLSLTGSLKSDDFVPLATGTIQVNDETVLGLLRKGCTIPKSKRVFHVAINERDKRCSRFVKHLSVYADTLIQPTHRAARFFSRAILACPIHLHRAHRSTVRP